MIKLVPHNNHRLEALEALANKIFLISSEVDLEGKAEIWEDLDFKIYLAKCLVVM